jgi:dUTP pyrophosphatase
MEYTKINYDAKAPAKAHKSDAGWDLFSLDKKTVWPIYFLFFYRLFSLFLLKTKPVRTGIAVHIPEGYYGRVAEKSGLANKNIGIGAGVIDCGYTGEIEIVVRNFNLFPYTFKKGDKVAQLIVEKISMEEFTEVTDSRETERGSGGFGSTGR